jgi:hypothetical protein
MNAEANFYITREKQKNNVNEKQQEEQQKKPFKMVLPRLTAKEIIKLILIVSVVMALVIGVTQVI